MKDAQITSGLRFLIVHPKVSFINPTTELWPDLFAGLGQITFFGPGFQTSEVLEMGLARFLDDVKKDFDFIVISEHISNPRGEENGTSERSRFLQRNYGYNLAEAQQLLASKQSWIEDALLSGIPIIMTFFEFDPYRVDPSWTQRVAHIPGYILGWGPELFPTLSSLERIEEEPFGFKATDDWRELLQERSSSVISMPAFVSDAEFNRTPLSARRHDWSVLGTNYALRREARSVLKDANIYDAGRRHHMTVATWDRISRGRIGNRFVQKWMRDGFQRALFNSRASFTCGSRLQYPVRKYFEIPAAGTLLVSPTLPGLIALGFRDRESFITAHPRDLPEVTFEFLGDNLDQGQQIAASGQQLVSTYHSRRARATQLKCCLDAIRAGDFRGSTWVDGHFGIVR